MNTETKKFNGHEYVDLGLPSETLWTKYNVGATSETDFGLFFHWGDTQGRTSEKLNDIGWWKYKFYSIHDGGKISLTKYNKSDNKTVLDPEDDAAHVYMGGDWRMPTAEQINELLTNTTYEVVKIDNVDLLKLTSKLNGKTLSIPSHSLGNIWSSSLGERLANEEEPLNDKGFIINVDEKYTAFELYSDADETILYSEHRACQIPVRGVVYGLNN